jgi:hypothetical protein
MPGHREGQVFLVHEFTGQVAPAPLGVPKGQAPRQVNAPLLEKGNQASYPVVLGYPPAQRDDGETVIFLVLPVFQKFYVGSQTVLFIAHGQGPVAPVQAQHRSGALGQVQPVAHPVNTVVVAVPAQADHPGHRVIAACFLLAGRVRAEKASFISRRKGSRPGTPRIS